jgi:hypothetical protein
LNLSGGRINVPLQVDNAIHISGTQFSLGGVDISSSLELDTPFTVLDRDTILTGILADGSPFSFHLSSDYLEDADYLHPGGTLTLTLVTPAHLAGDYNGDGIVNATDYTVWRNSLGTSGSGLAADGNGDQLVDHHDYNLWKQNYGQPTADALFNAPASVPEPATWLLPMCGLVIAARYRLRQ